MNNKTLIITYLPDPLHMTTHNGSIKEVIVNEEHNIKYKVKDNYIGLTSRSERESHKNIKSKEAATNIVMKRSNVLFATYNNEEIKITDKMRKESRLRRKESRIKKSKQKI